MGTELSMFRIFKSWRESTGARRWENSLWNECRCMMSEWTAIKSKRELPARGRGPESTFEKQTYISGINSFFFKVHANRYTRVLGKVSGWSEKNFLNYPKWDFPGSSMNIMPSKSRHITRPILRIGVRAVLDAPRRALCGRSA